MAKFHLDRLKDKYGWKTAVAQDQIRGAKYQSLIDEILSVNSLNIQKAVGRLSKDNYSKYASKLSSKEKLFVLPDVSEVLPKRSVYFLKAAERGKLITDTLRDRLTRDLRNTITDGALRTTGTKAGTVNPKKLEEFERNIAKTFETYTKKDPAYGMPSNIHNIAVTELRTNIDSMKYEYNLKLLQKNPDIMIMKDWIQNTKGVKKPRKTHTMLAKSPPLPFNENFRYLTENNVYVSTPHPHHPSMPAGEVIGCSCELRYRIVKRRK